MCSSFNVPPSGIIWFVKVISTDLSLPRDRQFYEIKELYIKDYIKTKKDEPNYENPICIAHCRLILPKLPFLQYRKLSSKFISENLLTFQFAYIRLRKVYLLLNVIRY